MTQTEHSEGCVPGAESSPRPAWSERVNEMERAVVQARDRLLVLHRALAVVRASRRTAGSASALPNARPDDLHRDDPQT